MPDLCADLRSEADEFARLVERADIDSDAVTPFYGWRVRNILAHLATIDQIALLALSDPTGFHAARAAFVEGTRGSGGDLPPHDVYRRMSAYESAVLGGPAWPQLLGMWREGLDELCRAANARDPAEKLEWFGPPMRLGVLLAARQMEVWAYGQDVFDLFGLRRNEGARLKNIADFAVRVFAFSFANRGMPVPAEKPYVSLAGPGGEEWAWNEPSATSSIRGAAVDFCLVATQRRNVADTALIASGEVATDWMRIAQCITGPPLDGPAPGARLAFKGAPGRSGARLPSPMGRPPGEGESSL